MFYVVLWMFSKKVGSYELTLVNVHMQATASPGESNGKNHNTDEVKCQRLCRSIQETLKGQSVTPEPRSAAVDCTAARLWVNSHNLSWFKEKGSLNYV